MTNNQLMNLRSSSPTIKFGDRVRRLRLELRLTQDAVIEACKPRLSSNSILSHIENNTFIPSIAVASQLADILNCTVGYLIGETKLKDAPTFDALWRDFYIDFTHLPESDMILLSNIAKLMLKKQT